MSRICVRVAEGIIAIDTEFVRRRMNASHLVVDDGHAAFVDTGTFFSVPNLLAALAAQGLEVVADAADKAERMTPMLFDHLSARLAARGFMGDAAQQHAVLDGDIALNAAGLALWLARRRT